jgi:hypothetical protein
LEKRKNRRDGCSGKKRYEDYEKAKLDAIALLENRKAKKQTTVYLCSKCSRFHVSSQKRSGWIALIRREDYVEDTTEEIQEPRLAGPSG